MRLHLTLLATLAAVSACGCATGPTTVRAQSPGAMQALYSPATQQAGPQQGPMQQGPIQQVGGHHRGIVGHPVYDATVAPHFDQHTAHFQGHGGMGPVNFPVDSCRTGVGGCPPGCNHLNPKCVRDARSYSYSQPKNLVYPNANATGGAVVYPYYTHKSPSDFFRK